MREPWQGTKTLIGLVVAMAVLASACSKGSSSATTSAPPTSIGGSSAGGSTVQQGAGGFVFAPSTLTVKKGETINVTNVGSVSHTFTITGKGIDVVNSAGQSQSVTLDLAPGTYQFICRFHVSLGMKGTLTVTA